MSHIKVNVTYCKGFFFFFNWQCLKWVGEIYFFLGYQKGAENTELIECHAALTAEVPCH